MTIYEVLEKLYTDDGLNLLPNTDAIERAKLALLEIIKGVKPKKKEKTWSDLEENQSDSDNRSIGFNQGVEAYEKAIEEMFK